LGGLSLILIGLELETSFQLHLNVIKDAYCVPKNVFLSKLSKFKLVLNPIALDMQWFLFVLIIKNNSKGAMVEPHSLNPFTCAWRQLTTSQILVQRMSEDIKLVENAIVQNSSYVEDEGIKYIAFYEKQT